jgi:hypothetical protein
MPSEGEIETNSECHSLYDTSQNLLSVEKQGSLKNWWGKMKPNCRTGDKMFKRIQCFHKHHYVVETGTIKGELGKNTMF